MLAVVDPARAPIPAYLIGRLEHLGGDASAAARNLAISINGSVEAITQADPGYAN